MRYGLMLVMVILCACQDGKEESEARLQRAERYLGRGDAAAALIEYRGVLENQPGDARALAGAGLAQSRLGNPREAYPLLQRAAAQASKEPEVSDMDQVLSGNMAGPLRSTR